MITLISLQSRITLTSCWECIDRHIGPEQDSEQARCTDFSRSGEYLGEGEGGVEGQALGTRVTFSHVHGTVCINRRIELPKIVKSITKFSEGVAKMFLLFR